MPTCRVTGLIQNLDGTPNTNVQVKCSIERVDDDALYMQGGQMVGGVGVTSDEITTYTEDDGTFAIDLLQGARVLLHIPAVYLRKVITVPASETADINTLI